MARSLILALFVVPAVALAHPTGISGYSGQNGGLYCISCHNSAGTPPSVHLTGPATLMPNETGNYTFTVDPTTGGVAAGLDVAVTGAAELGTADTATYLIENTFTGKNELTHNPARGFDGGSAVFSFTVKAPPSAGTVTLFAAGLSANMNGVSTGDVAAATTLMITVSSGATMGSPDAGMTQPMDAGSTQMTMTPPPPMDPGGQSQDDLDLGGMVEGGCSASGALPELAPLLALLILVRRLRG